MTATDRPEPKQMQPLEAIATFCLACRSGADLGDVQTCPAKACPLWAYRTGRYPQTRKEKR